MEILGVVGGVLTVKNDGRSIRLLRNGGQGFFVCGYGRPISGGGVGSHPSQEENY
jgi:hypothetical protein